MNKKNIFGAFFILLISLTDTNIIPSVSISDLCIIYFFLAISIRKSFIIPNQTIIFAIISSFGLFLGFINNNLIQYKTYFAALITSTIIGLFYKSNSKSFRSFNIYAIINYALVILSFFTILDFIYIFIFNDSLNLSAIYGIDSKSWTGYSSSGNPIIRPCGIYAEPGDNTSIILIFLSLKLYFNSKYNYENFSIKKLNINNLSTLLSIVSIIISKSTQGSFGLVFIIIYVLLKNLISDKFFNNIFNKLSIKKYKINKPNLTIVSIIFFLIPIIIIYVLPRILGNFNNLGSIDLTRAYTLSEVFSKDRGLVSLLFGTSFEKPNLLINSLTQFINLYYQFGLLSFILFYFMFTPAIKHSSNLFLFLFIIFISKYNFTTIPFWLAIHFVENEYQQKLLKNN